MANVTYNNRQGDGNMDTIANWTNDDLGGAALGRLPNGSDFASINDVVTQGTLACNAVTNDVGIEIFGGTFNGTFENLDQIVAGVFNGIVNNQQEISGGTFNAKVNNSSEISGGTFNAEVDNIGGEIDGGTFNALVYATSSVNVGAFNDRLTFDNVHFLYASTSPSVAPANKVLTGTNNLGVPGTATGSAAGIHIGGIRF